MAMVFTSTLGMLVDEVRKVTFPEVFPGVKGGSALMVTVKRLPG